MAAAAAAAAHLARFRGLPPHEQALVRAAGVLRMLCVAKRIKLVFAEHERVPDLTAAKTVFESAFLEAVRDLAPALHELVRGLPAAPEGLVHYYSGAWLGELAAAREDPGLTQRAEEAQQQLEELRVQIAAHERSVEALRADLKQSQDEHAAAESRLAGLRDSNAAAVAQHEEAVAQLKAEVVRMQAQRDTERGEADAAHAKRERERGRQVSRVRPHCPVPASALSVPSRAFRAFRAFPCLPCLPVPARACPCLPVPSQCRH